MCASLEAHNFCTTGSPICCLLDVSYVPCIRTDTTQFKGRAREHNSWCLMCVCVGIPSVLNASLNLSVYSVWAHQSYIQHSTLLRLLFSFNDVRVIRHNSRTMLLFPSLYILLFPFLDIVRTDDCATHYATSHVRDSTAQYYSVQIMLARSVPEVCLLETSSRDLRHCHSPSPSIVTHVVALPVYGLLRCLPLL